MSDVVIEVTPLDHVVAFLKKLGTYLADVRTVAMIMTIFLGLKTLGVVDGELEEQQVSATLTVIKDVVIALAELATVLIPVYKYIGAVTERPSRGLGPWLDAVKTKKAVAAYRGAKG